jgi:hypothetical protein
MMCFEEQGWIAGGAGKFETLTAEFVSGGQIARNHVVGGFTAKGDEQLVLVAQFLAKYTGLRKRLEDVRRGKALGCHQGHAQCSLEMNLLPEAALYPAGMQPVQVPCKWAIASGLADRSGCCPAWPIVAGLLARPAAVCVRQCFRLGLADLWNCDSSVDASRRASRGS